jgi:hypothetical protein
MRSWWLWASAFVLVASPVLSEGREKARERREGEGGRSGSNRDASHDRRSDRSDRSTRDSRASDGRRSQERDRTQHDSDRWVSKSEDARSSRSTERQRSEGGRGASDRSRGSSWTSRDSGDRSRRYSEPNRSREYANRPYSTRDRGRESDFRSRSYGSDHSSRWSSPRSVYTRPHFSSSYFYRYGSRYRYGSYYRHGTYYPRYYYEYDSYPTHASIRVLVDPPETEVYVDGYYAGNVDDFDGVFQRLYLAPGRHEIALMLDGFRTWRGEVYATPGHTLKLHHDMLPGAGERDVEGYEDDPAGYEER